MQAASESEVSQTEEGGKMTIEHPTDMGMRLTG
jgi:hypothetical protein